MYISLGILPRKILLCNTDMHAHVLEGDKRINWEGTKLPTSPKENRTQDPQILGPRFIYGAQNNLIPKPPSQIPCCEFPGLSHPSPKPPVFKNHADAPCPPYWLPPFSPKSRYHLALSGQAHNTAPICIVWILKSESLTHDINVYNRVELD